jgi:hypothetical protein
LTIVGLASIELGITRDTGGVGVRAYTSVLSHVLLMLEEIDRLATPGQASRPEWAVRGMSETETEFRLSLLPRTLPRKRDLESLSKPPLALVEGVQRLAVIPEIPRLFSEGVVLRLDHVGQQIGRGGITGLTVTCANGTRTPDVALTDEVKQHARQAVETASIAWSSVVGVLDVISSRRERRQIGLLTDEGRAVVCDVRTVPRDTVLAAFERRVVAAGVLKRNARGQAVRLDVESLEVLGAEPTVRARDLLGAAPDVTNGLSNDDFMAGLRDR